MEICKAPTLRPKELNKHTHIMYIEMEHGVNFLYFIFYIYIDKCSNIIMQKVHTHTHTCMHECMHPHAHMHAHCTD